MEKIKTGATLPHAGTSGPLVPRTEPVHGIKEWPPRGMEPGAFGQKHGLTFAAGMLASYVKLSKELPTLPRCQKLHFLQSGL